MNKSANLKQPIIFEFSAFASTLKDYSLKFLAREYGSFDVIVKEPEDYHTDKPSNPVVISLSATECLIKTDTSSKYYSDQNKLFRNWK